MIDQRPRSPFRALAAALAGAASAVLIAAQPAGAQPLVSTPPSLPSPQVTSNLTVRNSAPADIGLGDPFDYRFSVVRNGFTDTRRITVYHAAPPGLEYVSHIAASGFSCSQTFSTAGNVLTCTGTMSASGSSQTSSFAVRYVKYGGLEGGNYLLGVKVDENNTIPETNEGDNVATTIVRVPDWE